MEPIQMSNSGLPASYQDGHLRVDFNRQTATLDAQSLVLTRKEYELLSLLVQHAGEIVPRETLLMRVWGYSTEIRTRTLDVHIRRLRRKLGVYAEQYIETIFGIGYRFQPYRAKRILQPTVQQPAIALGA
jgi:two-component system, OmpR family, alkaline phosphatase synthesis response regulator PhoP